MAREFALFVMENGYGSPVTPTQAEIWTTAATLNPPGTASSMYCAFYARLDAGDSLTMRPRPVEVQVPFGGGLAIPGFSVADKYVLEGTYKCKFYAGAFGAFLLQWAAQQVNSLGYVGLYNVATGWQYGAAGVYAGNLPSVSIFHAIQRSDGTYKIRLYTGCKVKSWSFTLSEDSTIADISLNIAGSYPSGNPKAYLNNVDPTLQAFANPPTPPTFGATTTPSTFAPPSGGCFPISPYVFTQATPVTIGIARTTFQSIGFNCTNQLATRYWNNPFPQLMNFVGRDLSLTCQNFYTNMSPEDRYEYETLTAQTVAVTLNTGTYSIVFTLNTNNIIKTLEDSLPLEGLYTQTMTVGSQWDQAFNQQDAFLAADFQLAFTY